MEVVYLVEPATQDTDSDVATFMLEVEFCRISLASTTVAGSGNGVLTSIHRYIMSVV